MQDVLQDYPLSKLTTLKIGGPAKYFISVKTQKNLLSSIKWAKEKNIPYLVIGGGSNLLVSDQGFDGLVIKNNLQGTKKQSQHLFIKSGILLQGLVDFSINNGLAGLQRLTGIPGTVGGAIYGNAGAYGQTISDYLQKVIVLDPQTLKTLELTNQDCSFKYRDSVFKKNGYLILEAVFKLTDANPKTLRIEAEETLSKRLVKYPPGLNCPGSFFKNIPTSTLSKEILEKIPEDKVMFGKIPAGFLLEEVGAKGDQLGMIRVADNHGNTFINLGSGTANDFYKLAKKYHQKVKRRFEINLEPEVQLINLPQLR